jgi:phospholipase D1/2
MDYQYKSILRGEHSIFGQISKHNIDPTKYIFVFNLRTFDRLHTSAKMKQQEEQTGVPYQDVERAHAAELMGEGGATRGEGFSKLEKKDDVLAAKKKFESTNAAEEGEVADKSADVEKDVKDSVAADAMLHKHKLTDEKWDGDDETERDNFVQEELYIHAKLMIVDGRVPAQTNWQNANTRHLDTHVICGSANINDRSQCGDRDSEAALHIEDTKKIPSKMDGEDFEAGYHAATL